MLVDHGFIRLVEQNNKVMFSFLVRHLMVMEHIHGNFKTLIPRQREEDKKVKDL